MIFVSEDNVFLRRGLKRSRDWVAYQDVLLMFICARKGAIAAGSSVSRCSRTFFQAVLHGVPLTGWQLLPS